jgi:hypothetical protein
VAIVVAAMAACGGGREAPEPVAERRAASGADRRPQPSRIAVVWGADDVRAAARRLGRARWISSTSVLGRGTALLKSARRAGGRQEERVRAGFAVPLDVVAVDPSGYAPVLPEPQRRLVKALRRGQALLSETSARLRGVGTDGVLTLVGGRRLRVAGVVPDAAAQAAELVMHSRDPLVTAEPRNVVAVLRRGDVTTGEVARRAGGGARARYADDPRGPSGGGPARPAEMKARFGEPAVGLPYGSDWIRLEPQFVRRYVVTRRVPVLGGVSCHRQMMRPLRAAMSELERRGWARLVDPDEYAGCYAPRRIRPGGPLSLHAWGLAIDLNASRNPFGGRSRQDRRLVRVMKSHGFTWGGEWPTVRDPMHFEWRGR